MNTNSDNRLRGAGRTKALMSDHSSGSGGDETIRRSSAQPQSPVKRSPSLHHPEADDNHKQPERNLRGYLKAVYFAVVTSGAPLPPPPSLSQLFSGWGRLLCVVVNFLIFLIILVTLMNVFLLYMDEPLEFELRSLDMKKFNIAIKNTMRVHAKWELDVAVRNPNTKLRVDFRLMEFTLKYSKGAEMDTFNVEDFGLKTKKEMILQGNFSVPSRHPKYQLAKMKNMPPWMKHVGLENGTLDLEIHAIAKYSGGGIIVDVFNVSASCFDLPVNFGTDPGSWSWSGRHPCFTKNYNFFKDIF